MLAAVVERHPNRVDAVFAAAGSRRARGWRSDSRARARARRRAGPRPRSQNRGSAGASRSRCRPRPARRGSGPTRCARRRSAPAPPPRRRCRARRPGLRSTRHCRARPLPKVKSSPVTTPAAPIALPSSSATKSSALVAASAPSKSNTSIASAPAWANSASRWSRVVSRNGGKSGLKKRTGCGSKVATIAGRRSWKARAMARPTTAWWPRWKPSKLPSATMLPLRLSGTPPVEGQPLHRGLYRRRLVGREGAFATSRYSWTRRATITNRSSMLNRISPMSCV